MTSTTRIRDLIAVVSLVLTVCLAGAAWGQDSRDKPRDDLPNDPGDHDHSMGATHSLKQVQAALNNPLSSLWSLQFENTVTFDSGPPSRGTYRGSYSGVFQPAMPVPLTKDWTWISRPWTSSTQRGSASMH
jgi:hypothetical protein